MQRLHKASSPSPNANHIQFTNLAPRTSSEHYWASRALKAEALLSARENHYAEVSRVREEEEHKRSRAIEALETRYKEKHSSLEKLVVILISTNLLFVVLLIYLTTSHTRQSISLFNAAGIAATSFFRLPFGIPSPAERKNAGTSYTSWFSLNFQLPSRLTVPILSPWTSVIERQTSTINSPASSSFSKYLVLASILSAITISILIWTKTHLPQYHISTNTKGSDQDTKKHPLPDALQSIFTFFSGLGLFPSLAFWRYPSLISSASTISQRSQANVLCRASELAIVQVPSNHRIAYSLIPMGFIYEAIRNECFAIECIVPVVWQGPVAQCTKSAVKKLGMSRHLKCMDMLASGLTTHGMRRDVERITDAT